MRALEAIRRANQSGPPENSIRLRTACLGTVLVAIAACADMGEVSWATAVGAMAMVSLGMVFSFLTRSRPPGWIKILVALGASGAFAWFFQSVSAPAGGITSVVNPLTVLLVSVLAVHSFHVPARRDLLFSIGASAGLMGVGAAQAIQLRFGLFVLAWVCFSLWTLTEMWSSASGGGRISPTGLASAMAAMTMTAAAIFLVLPAPVVAAKLNFLAQAGLGGFVGVPGGLAGDSGSPTQPSRAGTPQGPTRVGGYLGFASSLNTALRGKLAGTTVMLVRAQRPSYWVGETFDQWDGENWNSTIGHSHPLTQRSPFVLPVPEGNNPLGQSDLQTFYVASPTADLVFHAESADKIWFPASKVFYSNDGTIVSPIGLGTGAIYTVESAVTTPTPAQLRSTTVQAALSLKSQSAYLQLPKAYERVHSLALSITTGATTNYDRVQALIAWIGAHTRYSTDIPPLPAGADTVDEFLFGNRVGFCEQISTSLAVMLRTLGIPAREAVGYVPGPYNPITDLYEIRANDAHAWVQVWFPGSGWQSFDPTAVVPLANPAPGTIALGDIGRALARIPLAPAGSVVLSAALLVGMVRWRRLRPPTWAGRIAGRIERAGRRAGHPRRPNQTLGEYAALLDTVTGSGSATWSTMASVLEASAYGGCEPSPETRRYLNAGTRRTRIGSHRTLRVRVAS
jgi:transglutaminase-like putative cysteine protease